MSAWEKQRHRSLGRPKHITIGIRELQKQNVSDTHTQVTFIQDYQSNIYSDQVMKTLELIWENGSWKILKESSQGLAESSESQDALPTEPAKKTITEQPASATEAKVSQTAAVEGQEEKEEQGMETAEPRDIADVEKFVESWVNAWEQQDAITYLSHYSSNFITPDGMSMVSWSKKRHEVLTNQQIIKIEIRDMQIQKVDNARMQVTFIQEYQSETYSDKVVKTLELVWEKENWMIIQETSKVL